MLGEAFAGTPLRTLLVKGSQYGNRADIRAQLERLSTTRLGRHRPAVARRALRRTLLPWPMSNGSAWRWRRPALAGCSHYVSAFFRAAFTAPRWVPRVSLVATGSSPSAGDDPPPSGAVLARYERVTFRPRASATDGPNADLLAPGHPLLDIVLDHTEQRCRSAVERGQVLVRPPRPRRGSAATRRRAAESSPAAPAAPCSTTSRSLGCLTTRDRGRWLGLHTSTTSQPPR
ncbi:hypothetical protein HBB16_17500 [Pseudonocardia sp. MCCB 268]|nr:hypothetical protein [Pseudonocardia cytotoxica]